MLHGVQSLLLWCRGFVVPHGWRWHQDKTSHYVLRRTGRVHGYSSSRHDHILKCSGETSPPLRKEKGILGVWVGQQCLGPALSAQKGAGLDCVKPRTGINPPKRPFPQEFSMFYFMLIIFSLSGALPFQICPKWKEDRWQPCRFIPYYMRRAENSACAD